MAPAGIRVVTVNPGYIDTRMTRANPDRMPFLMSAKSATHKIARAINRGASYVVLPGQLAIVARLLRLAPNWLYDRVLARAPHKPRLRG